MDGLAVNLGYSPKPIRPTSPWIPCPAIEEIFPEMPKVFKDYYGKLLRVKDVKQRFWVAMAGDLAFVTLLRLSQTCR